MSWDALSSVVRRRLSQNLFIVKSRGGDVAVAQQPLNLTDIVVVHKELVL